MSKRNQIRWWEWRTRLGFAYVGAISKQVSQRRWQKEVDLMGPRICGFLQEKWQFPPMWDGGNGYPPRPRSAAELAFQLGGDVVEIRKIDWEIVDLFRSVRRRDPAIDEYLTAPIDAAPEWWDRRFGWLLMPDGSHKSKRKRGTPPPGPPDPPVHKIEDEGELREHMRRDHGLEYALQLEAVGGYHLSAHRDEAQDREWDRLFREGPQQVR